MKQPLVSSWVKDEPKWREIWDQATAKVTEQQNELGKQSTPKFPK